MDYLVNHDFSPLLYLYYTIVILSRYYYDSGTSI